MPAGRLTWRRRLARLGLAVGVFALTLFAAELGLRTLYPIHAAIAEPDDRYLFRMRPGSRTVHVPVDAPGRRIPISINRAGFRGPELSPPEPGAYRVVVYGDSFVLAKFSRREATFPVRLAAELAARQVTAEVINAGAQGYGPDQALLRMRDELAELEPDLVLFTLYAGNDFGDLIRNKLFRLDDDGRLVERAHELHPQMRSELRRQLRQPLLVRLLDRGWRRARYGGRQRPPLTLRFEEWRRQHIGELNDYFENDLVSRLFEDHYDIQLASDPEAVPSLLKLRLLAAVLAGARAVAAAHRVPLVAVLVPPGIDLCEPQRVGLEPESFPGYRPRILAELQRRAAAMARTPSIDLEPPFQDAGGCTIYFPGPDAHWNEAGQELAARIVATRLLATGWPGDEGDAGTAEPR